MSVTVATALVRSTADDAGSKSSNNRTNSLCSSELYAAGDIPASLLSKASSSSLRSSGGLDAFVGSWELLPGRSESPDDLMKALGFGLLKRNVMRNYKTQVDVSVTDRNSDGDGDGDDDRCAGVVMVSHLPLGTKKEVSIKLDGTPVEVFDSDTNVTWTSVIAWVDGNRLCQRRTSSLGTMYDVRCIFDCDPEGLCSESPLMLFRWTFVDAKGKICSANRWLRKLPSK